MINLAQYNLEATSGWRCTKVGVMMFMDCMTYKIADPSKPVLLHDLVDALKANGWNPERFSDIAGHTKFRYFKGDEHFFIRVRHTFSCEEGSINGELVEFSHWKK